MVATGAPRADVCGFRRAGAAGCGWGDVERAGAGGYSGAMRQSRVVFMKFARKPSARRAAARKRPTKRRSRARVSRGAGMTRISHGVRETEALAAGLGRKLVGGECIALEGELGAGKTRFVRGLLHGLGGQPRSVSSPTFVLLNVYDSGRLTVYHLDAYRVGGAEDFEAIGFNELLEQGGVVVIEWASRVGRILPERRIDVKMEITGGRTRRISVKSDLVDPV